MAVGRRDEEQCARIEDVERTLVTHVEDLLIASSKSPSMTKVESVESSSSDANPQERRARRKEIMAEKRAHKRKGSGSNSRTTKANTLATTITAANTPTPMVVDMPETKKRPVLLASKPKYFSSKATAATSTSSRRSIVRAKQTLRREVRPLSSLQKQKVDTVFEKLFGYQWGTEFAFEQEDEGDDTAAVTPRVRLLLRRMLGPRSAARLLRLEANGETLAALRQTQADTMVKRATAWSTPVSAPTVAAASTTAKAVSSNELPSKAAPASKSAAAAGSGGGGVDDLLQKMNETGKISTITRTANDWESFKTDNAGLGASLEEYTESKGAFLKKKDFLERVDHRKFTHERNERERNRLKNSKK